MEMEKTKKEVLRKIHKSMFTHGSLASCGITAYSPKHIRTSWRGVNCKNCLKPKQGGG